jgi:hypothetical protein
MRASRAAVLPAAASCAEREAAPVNAAAATRNAFLICVVVCLVVVMFIGDRLLNGADNATRKAGRKRNLAILSKFVCDWVGPPRGGFRVRAQGASRLGTFLHPPFFNPKNGN